MNPSVVNRKEIITKFKLNSSRVVPKNEVSSPDEDIIHKTHAKKHYLNPAISIKLPSISEKAVEESKYIYYLDQVLNSAEPKFTSGKHIQLCIFKVIQRPRVSPFLLYLLNKDSKTNVMYFPHFQTQREIFDEAREKISKIYENYSEEPHYKGYYETDHNIYLFYERDIQSVEELRYGVKKNEHMWWWITIFEIVNEHKALNYSIDRTVYSIFFKNPLLISLYNTNQEKIETPYIVYFGGYENYIAFIASFGLPKESPTSNLGPYYYFYTYYGAGRRAIWTESRKETERNGEIITRDKYGVHKKGGIVRFVLFGNKIKFFLNRKDDPEDKSDISQELAKTQPFIKSTLKLRDVNGKWAINNDLAYIGAAFIKSEKYKDRKLAIQWAARDFYQQIPLTYHYVDTTEFSNIKDEETRRNLPYEYENYNIE